MTRHSHANRATRTAAISAFTIAVAWGATAAAYPVHRIWAGTNAVISTNTATSTWSFREGPVFPYTLLPNAYSFPATPGNLPGWYDPAGPNQLPAIFEHKGQVPALFTYISGTNTIGLPRQTIYLHPAANSRAVLEFTVPPNHNYIKGEYAFTQRDGNCGNGVTWGVTQNGALVAPTATGTLSTPLATTGNQILNFPVAAGDKIDFVVDSNGNDACDAIALTGFIGLN